MHLQTFFENFETVTDAPNGPVKLRETVLELAFQGRLVPQNPRDDSAFVLVDQINAEKERLIEKGLIRKPQSFPISEDEVPFPSPQGWKWVRLNDVFDVRDGTHDTPKYLSSGFPLVTSKNLYTGSLDLSNVKYISETDHRKISERSKVEREDILFAMIGTIGNPVIVDVDTEFSIKNVALFKYYCV